ncbi:MAG: hypothetical protein HQK89_05265 [Nitrospirae bacterium]|nr:hypothetical protein [Nitrospirota bacterium]
MIIRNKKTSFGPIFLVPVYLLALLLIYSCGSGGGGGTSAPDYTPGTGQSGVPFKVLLSPTTSLGQTNAPIFMTAYVSDINGMPVKNTNVNFTKTTGVGQITASSTTGVALFTTRDNSVVNGLTNQYGQAAVQVTSTASGFVTVEAVAGGGLMDKKSVLFGSSGAKSFSPIFVSVSFDGNGNGVYDENDDFKVCQGTTTNTVKLRATVYYKGERVSGSTGINGQPVYVYISSDNDRLTTFPYNIYFDSVNNVCTYPDKSVNGAPASGAGCIYTGTFNNLSQNHVKEDFVTINSTGDAYSTFNVNCQLTATEQTLNLFAVTSTFVLPEFSSIVAFQGQGGASLFLEPITVTSVKLTANPTQVAVGSSSAITATVNTNLGNATAPDGTLVQFTVDCQDVSVPSASVSPNPAQTVNGVATTIFTSNAIPVNGTCTVTGKAGGVTSAPATFTIVPVLSVNPAAATLTDPKIGDTYTFQIIGGTPAYTVTSDNPAVSVTLSGKNVIAKIVSYPPKGGTNVANIKITDAKSVSVTATLTISISPLAVSPPSQTVVNPKIGDTMSFAITGGVGPYTVTSSNTTVLTVALSGTNGITATIKDVPVNGSVNVTITVIDAQGTTVTVPVTITTAATSPLIVVPNPYSVTNPNVGDTLSFTIKGGMGPYTITSSNKTVLTVAPATLATAGAFTATILSLPASGSLIVTITVIDAQGTTVNVPVTITVAANSQMTVVPNPFAVTNPNVGDTMTFTIKGGTGPYTITSSNKTMLTVPATLAAAGPFTATIASLPANGSSVTINIIVIDSLGATVTVPVTITMSANLPLSVAPPSASLIDPHVGDTLPFVIIGGTGPYTITSSNKAVLAVPVVPQAAAGPFTATIVSLPANVLSMTVTITVIDALGASVTVQVSITLSGNSALSVAPTTATLTDPNLNDQLIFSVKGGTAPYIITSDTPKVLTVVPNPLPAAGNITATVVSVPVSDTVTVHITIVDATNATIQATVNLVRSPLTITPKTLSVSSGGWNAIGASNVFTFFISGGSPPYTNIGPNGQPAISHPQYVTAAIAGGNILTVTKTGMIPPAGTTIIITVYDSTGNATNSATATISVVP